MITPAEFQTLWETRYVSAIPITHLFKYNYPLRWFRIHSLPHAKRYADTDEEWATLLGRQNQLMTDLLGEDAPILLVTGVFHGEDEEVNFSDSEVYQPYLFQPLPPINLAEQLPLEYYEGQFYTAAFAEIPWKSGQQDALLRAIANDETRAFWVGIEKDVLIAPYDGGVDIIVGNYRELMFYAEKYASWVWILWGIREAVKAKHS